MNLVSFAFRNLGRNRRRTVISILGATLSTALMVVYGALMEGMMDTMRDNITRAQLGDLQIHPPDYRDKAGLYLTIPDAAAMVNRLEEKGLYGSARLKDWMLGATRDNSAGIRVTGIDPVKESRVTDMHTYIARGKWIATEDPRGVVLGTKVAKNLGLSPGDELIILGQAADGSMANDIYRIRGVLKPVDAITDRSGLWMTRQAFRDLLLLEHGAHEIALRRVSEEDPLTAAVQRAAQVAPGQEVESWRQMSPAIADLLDMSGISLGIMFFITYTALGLLLLNSGLMSVYERQRELGILKALGMRPPSIVVLILLESLLQTLAGVVPGVLLGVGGAWLTEYYPLDLTMFTDQLAFGGVSMSPEWYGRLTGDVIMQPAIFLFVIIMFSGLYPAIKAARVNPVESISGTHGF